MVYRLYRREPVLKDKWYYAVKCKGCKELIYILDDPSKGAQRVQMQGDGELSVPCRRCGHDDFYSIDDPQIVQATESIDSSFPRREPISKSSRKPLLKSYPNAKVTIGIGLIEDRPKAAALIGRIITAWADIEVQAARLLAELMEAHIPQTAAVFGSLRSSRAQSDALTAVAEVVLDEADLLLFQAHVFRKAALEKERNDLAHGCFGVSVSIPDHIVWVSQSDLLQFTAAHKVGNKTFDLRSKQFVYELGILERIAEEIVELYHQFSSFIGYLSARRSGKQGADFRKFRYPQLCKQAFIMQTLADIRSRKAKAK